MVNPHKFFVTRLPIHSKLCDFSRILSVNTWEGWPIVTTVSDNWHTLFNGDPITAIVRLFLHTSFSDNYIIHNRRVLENFGKPCGNIMKNICTKAEAYGANVF